MGLRYSCLIALLPNARGHGPRGEHGWSPPNQPHQMVPTGWVDGWMGLDAPPDAVVMPRPELNRPTGVLIQGVHNKSSRRPQPTVPGSAEVQGGCSWDMRGHFAGRGTFGSWPMRGRVGGRKSEMGLLRPPQGSPAGGKGRNPPPSWYQPLPPAGRASPRPPQGAR